MAKTSTLAAVIMYQAVELDASAANSFIPTRNVNDLHKCGVECEDRRGAIIATLTDHPEQAKLAQLFAASPYLLEALKKCEDVIGMATLTGKLSDNAFSQPMEALIAAREALDKTR